MSFADLGLRAPLTRALARSGITDPFPIQELTIPDVLAGRDVCGKARTGSGKTLAFGLPLLERLPKGARPGHPRALVLAPTRELARQISDVLKPLAKGMGLRVAPFHGGTAMERHHALLKAGVEVAVATPGRFIDLIDQKRVNLDDVSIVVVDEADRMADMGFLPQLEWILRRLDGRPTQTLLFSATLDGDVDVLVRRYLRDPVRHEVESEPDTIDDMTHRFLHVHEMDRMKVVTTMLRSASPAIVFVRTKRRADRFAKQLAREGVRVASLHGDLRQAQRERVMAKFVAGDFEALVATDVAARGLDIDDVALVLHLDPAEDAKAYLHRSGRTARAGRKGIVATLALWDQLGQVEELQKRLGSDEPVVEVFSNDPRLADLAHFGGGVPPRPAPDESRRPTTSASAKISRQRPPRRRSLSGVR